MVGMSVWSIDCFSTEGLRGNCAGADPEDEGAGSIVLLDTVDPISGQND
jgi:hypothetical protein